MMATERWAMCAYCTERPFNFQLSRRGRNSLHLQNLTCPKAAIRFTSRQPVRALSVRTESQSCVELGSSAFNVTHALAKPHTPIRDCAKLQRFPHYLAQFFVILEIYFRYF